MRAVPLHLILLAGGRGSRAGGMGDVPKQFRVTGRGALFAVSLRSFAAPVAVAPWRLASVTVAAPEAWHEQVAAELTVVLGADGLPRHLARPGATRTASTWCAVQCLAAETAPADADLVAVHDAARPFASVDLLDALARSALVTGAAVPGVPLTDTVVRVGPEGTEYLERDTLVGVQTPQVFRWGPFAAAQAWADAAGRAFTDDGGLLAARGLAPAVVPGEIANWKVTTAADWQKAAAVLADPAD